MSRQKLSLEEIKEFTLKNSPNIEILEEFQKEIKVKQKKYIKRYFRCRCKIDAHIWNIELSNLKQGKGCPKCSGKGLTLEEIREFVLSKNPDLEILRDFKKETGVTKKLIKRYVECRCLIDGHIWTTDLSNIKQGKGCPKCGIISTINKQKFTLEQIIEMLKIINPNIEILSKEYFNNNTPLKCKCLIDGNVWYPIWSTLQQGNGCPKCAIKKGEKNNQWKGGITPLSSYLRNTILEWKYDSYDKYNFKCDIRGVNNKCSIHHLHNFSDIVLEVIDTLHIPIHETIGEYTEDEIKQMEERCLQLHYKYGLGICLCEEEHMLFHSIYGRKNNTKEQYEEFKNKRILELKMGV